MSAQFDHRAGTGVLTDIGGWEGSGRHQGRCIAGCWLFQFYCKRGKNMHVTSTVRNAMVFFTLCKEYVNVIHPSIHLFIHPSFQQKLSIHAVSFTILNRANKILTLSHITLITEVFLEPIHQRQSADWVSHFH